VTADSTLVLYTAAAVSADARVWLAAADVGVASKARKPKSATAYTAPSGFRLVEVVL
jgi:hypothetical protein